MKWLVAAVVALTAWLGAPAPSAAQDPPPPPPPTTAPPPEGAVPRAEAPPPPARAESRPEPQARPESRGDSQNRAERAERQAPDRSDGGTRGSNRAEGAVDRAPRSEPRAERPALVTESSTAGDQQRRGSVRRPPSSDGGGRAGAGDRERAVARDPSNPPSTSRDRDRGRPGINNYPYYDPYYYRRYRGDPGYSLFYDPWGYGSFGLGYFYYSPWAWYPNYSYGGGYPAYIGGSGIYVGAVKLKVKPRDAAVYVDGYYAGTVDDFDGAFQSLKLDSGGYRIEVRKPGYETLQFDVRVQPDRTITFRGDMRPAP